MMTREQVAVAIVKIGHSTLMLRYWLGLRQKEYPSVLDPMLVQLGGLSKGIDEYLAINKKQDVYELLINEVIAMKDVKEFLKSHRRSMPKETMDSLLVFLSTIERLQKEGAMIHDMSKGEYHDLADGLDNPVAAEMLKRAQSIKVLNKHFQPMKDITGKQLKVIAFAINQRLGINGHVRWDKFNKQWSLKGNKSLYKVHIYNEDEKGIKLIMSLYPEVDFSPLFAIQSDMYFRTKHSEETIASVYHELRANGYISKKSSLKDFENIFKPMAEGKRKPIEWMLTARQLAFFVYHFLREGNELKSFWRTTENCFSVQGKKPNGDSMSNFITKIRRGCQINTYDAKLSDILNFSLLKK